MKLELHNYDIFPKVFIVREPVEITVKPLGSHVAFRGSYKVAVMSMAHGNPVKYPNRNNICEYEKCPDADGCIRISHTFPEESEYIIRIFQEEKMIVNLYVYALEEDMRGRYPYRGDMHLHTNHSDGMQSTAVVAANYRKNGYDFISITDHGRYYPSLESIDDYKEVPHEMNLVYGEEIHLPDNDIHLINFGGKYSVNGLVDCCPQSKESDRRAVIDNPPPVLTLEQYKEEINELISELNIPEDIEAFTYASCVWAFRHIRKGEGLGIFAHPYWKPSGINPYQVPESLCDYILETQPFDALEVMSEDGLERCVMLIPVKYYEDRKNGRKYPIVASTDSHDSIPEFNEHALLSSTLVFAKGNERKSLISAVKDFYTVAVDTAAPQKRLTGEFRLVKYARFILDEFTPIHDELCYEEGRLMKAYAVGEEGAKEALEFIYGRMKKLYEKYFAV